MSSSIHSVLVGQTWRAAGLVKREDGAPITANTVNYYLKALTGANAGKWYRNSDSSWQNTETANAMTHQADGLWTLNLTASPFVADVMYLEYAKESADLHVPGNGRLLRGQGVVDAVNVTQLAGGTYKIASTTGNFATAGTWASGVVPAAGDNIIIRDGKTVTVAASLNLGQFGTLELQGNGKLNIASSQTVAVVPRGWVVGINYGTVTNNYGTVTNNYGTVTNNYGTVGTNNGTVTSNEGTVTENYNTVGTSNGTVEENYGTVTENYNGTVTENYNTVGTNNGTVFGGTVTNNEGNHFQHQTGDSYPNASKLQFAAGNRVKAAGLSPQAGIGDNAFQFILSAAPATGKVLSAGGSSDADLQVLDATQRTTTSTAATVGTQWQLTQTATQHDPGWTEDGNGDPWIEYSSSNEAVATVNSEGLVEYVGDGTCIISGTSKATEYSPSRTERLGITNSTSGGETIETVEYVPDAFDAAKHVLIVYNAAVQDSVDLKDYYLAHRAGMAMANVLGLTGLSDATSTTTANVTSLILNPVYVWLVANEAAKPIRYIVVMRGVPSRQGSNGSVGYMLYDLLSARAYRTGDGYKGGESRFTRAQYQGVTCLPTWIDMGSYAASVAYIDKLEAAVNAGGLQADGVTIDGSEAGVAGYQWLFDEKRSLTSYPTQLSDDAEQVQTEGIDAGDVTYQGVATGPMVMVLSDPLWYGSWGVYTSTTLPSIVAFLGLAGWWVMDAIQSYGGQYAGPHVDPVEVFAATAFGGTDYSNTPIGFVGYTAEPSLSGIQTRHYAGRWARGWTFAEAVWVGRSTRHILAVGDPLVTR